MITNDECKAYKDAEGGRSVLHAIKGSFACRGRRNPPKFSDYLIDQQRIELDTSVVQIQ